MLHHVSSAQPAQLREDIPSFDNTSLDTTDRNSANTRDLIDILERKTERLIGGTRRWVNSIECFKEGLAGGLASLGLLLPALVPRSVGRDVDHVVAVEAGDRHERDSLGVVANLLDEVGRLLDDLVESLFGPLGGVHLVDGADELLDTQCVGEQSVLTSLAILGDTGFELTSAGGDNENSAVGLRGTSNHVLDEVTMAWCVDDGDVVLGSLELP